MANASVTRARILAVFMTFGLSAIAIDFLAFGLSRDIEAIEVISSAERDVPIHVGQVDLRSIKVMTYNLNHTGRGNHGDPSNDLYFPAGTPEWYKLSASTSAQLRDPSRVHRHLDKIARFIRLEEPDILFLQEVDRGTPESRWVDTAVEVVRRTGYRYAVWGPKWTLRCGIKYITGNAILSKYPIVEAENIALNPVDLAHSYRQLVGVHTALSVTVEVNGMKLKCLNTHLYSKQEGYEKKAEQVRKLVELVRDSPYPVIVGGDLNTSVKRLKSAGPMSMDLTLGLLTASGIIDMGGIHDDDTLDYIFLRAGDRTRYLTMHKMPPVLPITI